MSEDVYQHIDKPSRHGSHHDIAMKYIFGRSHDTVTARKPKKGEAVAQLTSEQIAKDVGEYMRNGGVIRKIEKGVSALDDSPSRQFNIKRQTTISEKRAT